MCRIETFKNAAPRLGQGQCKAPFGAMAWMLQFSSRKPRLCPMRGQDKDASDMSFHAPIPLQQRPAGIAHGPDLAHAAPASLSSCAGDSLDLGTFLAIVRRNWLIVALTTLVTVLPVFLWLHSVPALYTATAEIYVTPQQKSLVGGGLFNSGLSSDLMMIESQTKLISSESVLRRVVEEQNLAQDPEFNGTRPAFSLRARLMALLGKAQKPAGSNPEETALRTLAKRLSVRRAEKTFIISISVTSEDAAKAARLANAVARAYIHTQTAARAAAASRVNSLLSGRLEDLRRQVAEAEEAVAAFKRSHNIVATKKGQLENEARLARLGEELVKARSRAAAARAKYENIKRLIASGAAPEATYDALNSPVISRLRADYSRAAGLAASLAESLGPRHPRLLAAKARARSIARQIRAEAARLAKSAKSEYAAAQAEVAAIRRNLERVKTGASITNEARVRLQALEREAQARRTLYEKFLLKAKESGEARNLQIPSARIISPAMVPQYPSFPRKKLILGLALLLGMGLGTALALFFGLRKPPAAAPRASAPAPGTEAAAASTPRPAHGGPVADIQAPAPAPVIAAQQPLDLPVLASLPVLPGMENASAEDRLYGIYETMISPIGMGRAAFATATMNILRALSGARVIAITAPLPAQGATTLAWALTAAASLGKARVLVVDANHAHPQLGQALAPAGQASLRQALLGWVRPEELLVHDPDTGMDVLPLTLPSGFMPAAHNAAAFRAWLGGLFGRYDKVIIDATPIPQAVNVFNLVSLVDAILVCASPALSNEATLRDAAALVAGSGKAGAIVWNMGAGKTAARGPFRNGPAHMEAAQ